LAQVAHTKREYSFRPVPHEPPGIFSSPPWWPSSPRHPQHRSRLRRQLADPPQPLRHRLRSPRLQRVRGDLLYLPLVPGDLQGPLECLRPGAPVRPPARPPLSRPDPAAGRQQASAQLVRDFLGRPFGSRTGGGGWRGRNGGHAMIVIDGAVPMRHFIVYHRYHRPHQPPDNCDRADPPSPTRSSAAWQLVYRRSGIRPRLPRPGVPAIASLSSWRGARHS
jgi:hypothetical protein